MINNRSFILVFTMFFALPVYAQDAQNPHGNWTIDISCADCHTAESWTPLKAPLPFEHGRDTGFALMQTHALVSCASCHEELQFSQETFGGGTDCNSCHLDVHAGLLSTVCSDCHSQTQFDDVDVLAIHLETNFPLLGAHQATTCESCHEDDQGGRFALIGTACIDCHESDYLATSVIPHKETGFGTDCENCHTEAVWQDAILEDHATLSGGFALVGAHEFAGCETCHRRPGFQLVFDASDEFDCIACHRADYNDEHEGSGTPFTCLDCHSRNSWEDAEDDDE